MKRTDFRWPDESVGNTKNRGKKRDFIHDLKPGIVGGAIVGIIISKQDARSFVDRKDPTQMRWQLKFTLRDSPDDFINVCCWGEETYVTGIASAFRIGDVVTLENVLVQSKQHTEAEEKYNPSTPSPYSIVMNEKYALLQHCQANEFDQFHSVAFLPVKEHNDYYTLGDIINNSQILHGSHINILAAVRDCGFRKDILTKSGKKTIRHELTIFDETCMSLPLVMWDNELSELANEWRCRETVIFIADVKVHFDEYRKCMMATCGSKSIITINPDIPEAHHLYAYAQNVNIEVARRSNDVDDAGFEIESIQEVFTVEKLQQRLLKCPELDTSSCFYGIIYACFTHFDLDCFNAAERLMINTCPSCKRRLNMNSSDYSQIKCLSCHEYVESSQKQLNLRVDLSDMTGGLSNLTMRGNSVQKIINYSMDNFEALNIAERTSLKWKFLLERYKVFFKCYTGKQETDPLIVIVHAEPFKVADMQNS